MKQRITFQETSPKLVDLLMQTEDYIKKSGIPVKLMELIKYRVSQINGCAYCLDMHHKEAIHHGETETRLHSVIAWRECPFYTGEEKSALEFAEVLTRISEHQITDELFESLRSHFSKQEIADLTLLINQINLWNRFMLIYGTTPGSYKVKQV